MLLEKFKSSITNPAERNDVEQAYLQRKDNLAKIPEQIETGTEDASNKTQDVPFNTFAGVVKSVHGDALSEHTYEDIGKYTFFPKAMQERMLPSVMYGRYKEDEFEVNGGKFALQTREEGLRITNDLARLTLPHERNIDYEQIAAMTNVQVKEEILQDEDHYVALYQDMSLSLIDYIDQ